MRIRHAILAEESTCAYCARPGQPDDIIDHIRPLAEGGTDARENLRRCCRRCHARKTGRESVRGRR
jgi:5-methylcytosine-specific restriction protein A